MDAIICFATVCHSEEGNKINCNTVLIFSQPSVPEKFSQPLSSLFAVAVVHAHIHVC